MVPIIPFNILLPLALIATASCITLIMIIVVRRAFLKWYLLDGRRLTAQAVVLLRFARIGKDTEGILKWLGRNRATKIESLVRAIAEMEAGNGQLRNWLASSTGIAQRLAEIVTGTEDGRHHTRAGRWTRVAAAKAAGDLKLIDTSAALISAMDDPDPEVGYAAADALARLNHAAGAEAILKRITVRPRLNNARLAALVEAMNCDLTETFRGHLMRDDPQAQFWATTLVGEKEVFELVSDIRPLLSSSDANVRAAACECIGELNIPLTDRWLEPLLDDEMWFVRSHAAKSLGELRATWAVYDLAKMLTSTEWWVRQNASDALIKIGKDSAEAVEPLLFSADRFARHSAIEILESIGWIEEILRRLVRRDPNAPTLLRQFGLNGGLGYLENALFSAPEESIPALLEILRDQGDDATYGRVRAAAEQMTEALRPLAYEVAAEVKGK